MNVYDCKPKGTDHPIYETIGNLVDLRANVYVEAMWHAAMPDGASVSASLWRRDGDTFWQHRIVYRFEGKVHALWRIVHEGEDAAVVREEVHRVIEALCTAEWKCYPIAASGAAAQAAIMKTPLATDTSLRIATCTSA